MGGSYARTNLPNAVSATAYNANNQLTTWGTANLFYDLNGNMTSDGTHSYAWDARNRLNQIDLGNTASFTYDPFRRRATKNILGTATNFLYDGANTVQEVIGGSNTANSLSGGIDEVFQRTDSSGARTFLTDALGSTLGLTDSTGTLQTEYTFEPFGNTSTTGAVTTNSFAYTGRELDAGNLYYYRARYYSPTLQRFITEDPLGLRAGPNAYAYAWNNPINLVDPLGLESGTTLKLINDMSNSGPLPPMFPFAGRKEGPDRVNEVNRCAGELSQAGSVSNLSGGHVPELLGSNTFGDVASLGLGSGGLDQGAALAADATAHAAPAIATQVAVGTVTSIGKAISNTPGVYNPVTVGITTRTVGMTTAGKVLLGAAEGLLTGKVLLDAGVYVGALVVCSQ